MYDALLFLHVLSAAIAQRRGDLGDDDEAGVVHAPVLSR